MNTNIQKLITQIENNILSWDEITTGSHLVGGREFLFRKEEIGHMHWNGDLDILFGKQLTEELRKLNLGQRHKYAPSTAITYPVTREEDIPLAVSLLRLSYLLHLKNACANNPQTINDIENELDEILFYSLVCERSAFSFVRPF